MIRALKASYDKLLLGGAVAVLAASGAWLWQQQAEVRRLRAQPVAAQLGGAVFQPAGLPQPGTAPAVWPKAPAQSSGSGWLYEVFTPPVIYYNTLARSFTVTPPMYQGEAAAPFGLELIAVRLEPYRLQLVGYAGGPGDYLAAFTSPATPETLLAREGRHFESLGLTLKSFDVKKVSVDHADPWPVYDIAALAVVTEDKTGRDVVLDNRTRKLTDTPLAMLRVSTAEAKPRELHEGDTFSEAGSTYRIERIQLDPPEVVVARSAPGLPVPETKILHPAGKPGRLAGPATKPGAVPARPADGLAASGN
jgi:hypothetical protein